MAELVTHAAEKETLLSQEEAYRDAAEFYETRQKRGSTAQRAGRSVLSRASRKAVKSHGLGRLGRKAKAH